MGEFADALGGGGGETATAPDASGPSGSQGAGQTPAAPSGFGAPSSTSSIDPGEYQKLQGEHRTLTSRYGWLPQQHVQPMRGFYESYTRDQIGTLIGELLPHLDNPVQAQRIAQIVGPKLASYLGIGQGQGRGFQPIEDEEPQPDFQLPDGTTFMSAKRLAEWRSWHDKQHEKKFSEKVKPIEEWMQTQQLHQVQSGMVQQANQNAESLFKKASSWVGFTENKAAIGRVFADLSQSMPAKDAFYEAYLQVMHGRIRESSNQAGQAKAQAIRDRAGASTPNPSRPSAVSQTDRPKTFTEAAERFFGVKAS